METLLSIEEVAGVLKVSEQTVRKWVFKRQIPYVKIGKVIRFRPSQIDKWIDGGGMAAASEDTDAIVGELFNDGH